MRGQGTICGGELGLRVDRRGRGFAIKHTGAVQEIVGILALMKEEAVGATYDLDAEEVVQGPQILEGKLSAKKLGDLSQEVRGAGRQYNVIDVEQQVRG